MVRSLIILLLVLCTLLCMSGCSAQKDDDLRGKAVEYQEEGDKLLAAGKTAQAIHMYQLAVYTVPGSWHSHRALALGYEKQKNYTAAVSEYRVVISLNSQALAKEKIYNPASVSFGHYWLSEALRHQGNTSEAKVEAEQALRIAETDRTHNKRIKQLAIVLRMELGNKGRQAS